MESLSLIVAKSKNGVIGKNGSLPWKIPEDLKRFREITLGHAVIMGRKTYDSIGKPLSGRRNLIITKKKNFTIDNDKCEVFNSLLEAIKAARKTDSDPIIIGGSEVYKQAIPYVTKMYITEMNEEIEGDCFFPSFEEDDFAEETREKGKDPKIIFKILKRKL